MGRTFKSPNCHQSITDAAIPPLEINHVDAYQILIRIGNLLPLQRSLSKFGRNQSIQFLIVKAL